MTSNRFTLSHSQRIQLNELSDYIFEEDPSHPKRRPTSDWQDVDNRLTEDGFTQVDVGGCRVIYQLPFEGMKGKVVKFALPEAQVHPLRKGSVQNRAEVDIYQNLQEEHPEALEYFNAVYASDDRSESNCWLITDLADNRKCTGMSGFDGDVDIEVLDPDVGDIDGVTKYIDYGKGVKNFHSNQKESKRKGTYYDDITKL